MLYRSQKSTTILLGVLLAVGTARADISTLLRGGYSNNNILQDDGYHYDKPKVPFEQPTTPRKCAVTDQNPDGSCGYDYPKPDQSFTLPNEYLPPTTTVGLNNFIYKKKKDFNLCNSFQLDNAQDDNNHAAYYNDNAPNDNHDASHDDDNAPYDNDHTAYYNGKCLVQTCQWQ